MKKKSFTALLLVLAMVLALGGCTQNKPVQSDASSSGSASGSVSTPVEAEVSGSESTPDESQTTETASPLTNGMHGYVLPVNAGTEYSIDLDGDGKEETIAYEVAEATQDADGVWTNAYPSVLSVNGVSFLSADADNPMDKYGFWLENPYETYYIVDVDAQDGKLELGIADWGSNDWLETYLFRYENGTLNYIGCVPSFPDADQAVYSGNNEIYVMDHLNIMQTWSSMMTYVYENGKFSRKAGQMTQPNTAYESVYLRKELNAYTEPDKSSKTLTLTPSDEPVQLGPTDDEHWVGITMADGTTGWIYFEEGYHMENGEAIVDAESVFEGLLYAG